MKDVFFIDKLSYKPAPAGMKRLSLLILMSLSLVLCACQENPVEGKWEAASKGGLLQLIGCGSIEFKSSRMYLCGATDRVEYDVLGELVVVRPARGDSLVCHLNGPDQMYFEMNGEKLYWNRVK